MRVHSPAVLFERGFDRADGSGPAGGPWRRHTGLNGMRCDSPHSGWLVAWSRARQSTGGGMTWHAVTARRRVNPKLLGSARPVCPAATRSTSIRSTNGRRVSHAAPQQPAQGWQRHRLEAVGPCPQHRGGAAAWQAAAQLRAPHCPGWWHGGRWASAWARLGASRPRVASLGVGGAGPGGLGHTQCCLCASPGGHAQARGDGAQRAQAAAMCSGRTGGAGAGRSQPRAAGRRRGGYEWGAAWGAGAGARGGSQGASPARARQQVRRGGAARERAGRGLTRALG